MLSLLRFVIHTFFLVTCLTFIVFGNIALVVFVYCKCVNLSFKNIFPNTVRKFINWLVDDLKCLLNGSQQPIYKMDRNYIEPILKALCENDCECVGTNSRSFA